MSEGYAGGLGEQGVDGAGRKSDRDAAHATGPAPAPASRLIPGTGGRVCGATYGGSPTVWSAHYQVLEPVSSKLNPT